MSPFGIKTTNFGFLLIGPSATAQVSTHTTHTTIDCADVRSRFADSEAWSDSYVMINSPAQVQWWFLGHLTRFSDA